MRVLLTGATGLIGSAVLAALGSEGHEVVAVVRSAGSGGRLPAAASASPSISPGPSARRLAAAPGRHRRGRQLRRRAAGQPARFDGAACMWTAPPPCSRPASRRACGAIVHISAIGVDRGATTAFARSKRVGDQALMGRDLDWVILRPSVVVGRAAYGGSALFRGLAALPVLPSVAGTGLLQVVQLDDLVATVLLLPAPDAPARIALEIAGPERLSLDRGAARLSPLARTRGRPHRQGAALDVRRWRFAWAT